MNTAIPQLLIVDDDPEIRSLLAAFLCKHNYQVSVAADGEHMWAMWRQHDYDLVVLDLMLPGEDGLGLCRQLRAQSAIPIIMLTAMGEATDRIVGLEMGADDYLAKPFSPRELLARIKAVLRRSAHETVGESRGRNFYFEGWQLDIGRRELKRADGTLLMLSAGEFDLLTILVENPQQVLSRDFLIDRCKGREANPFDRSIDVQLSRLRRKLEADPKEPLIIKTVRGEGYLFSLPVSRVAPC